VGILIWKRKGKSWGAIKRTFSRVIRGGVEWGGGGAVPSLPSQHETVCTNLTVKPKEKIQPDTTRNREKREIYCQGGKLSKQLMRKLGVNETCFHKEQRERFVQKGRGKTRRKQGRRRREYCTQTLLCPRRHIGWEE